MEPDLLEVEDNELDEQNYNETEVEDVVVPDEDDVDLSLVKTLDEYELDILNQKVTILK